MNRLCFFLFTFIFSVFYSCANQSAPTGGPKDEAPPLLLNSTPKQGQLNFKRKEIVLNFDEAVRLENAKEQFLITPRIRDEYEIKYRKNRVIITFEQPLDSNTTYSINFREGIKDLTEGNPADTLQLAFSTGPYLDSLSLSGTVTKLLTNKPANDVTVALYDANDTLNILNAPPIYLTKTNTEGRYEFNNVKNGIYRIYTLNDKNKNLTLESKSEPHGFLPDNIRLDSSLTDIDLPLMILDVRPLELQSGRQSGTVYNIKYIKPILDYHLQPMDTTITLHSNFTDESQTTIQLFNTFTLQDSLFTIISAHDSLQNKTYDTVGIKFEETQRTPAEFKHTLNLTKIIPANPKFEARLQFSKPVTHINYDSVFIYLDSTNVLPVTTEQMSWNARHDQAVITHPIDPALFKKPEKPTNPPPAKATRETEEETSEQEQPTEADSIPTPSKPKPPLSPHFYAAPASFISVESDSSQRINKKLDITRADKLAILLVEVETKAQNFFVQLLNTKNEVVAERKNEKNFEFKNVDPGEYRLRVLIDANSNGLWDPGNININKGPEPVIFYKNSEGIEKFTLRANWEYGPNVIIF